MSSGSRTPGVDSARKVLQILLQFSDERPEATVDELAESVSASVSSVYRYISLLREMDLVIERHRGTYALSPRALILAGAAEAASNIVDVVRPTLHRLTDASGEAALLVQQLRDSAVCVDLSQCTHPVRLSFAPGQMLALHRGAAAKLLLASRHPAAIGTYLDRYVGAASDPERRRLEADLEEIRTRGWAESSAEVDRGVWATAAPIRVAGNVVAALSVAAPEYRIDAPSRESIIQMVIDAASAVSAEIASGPR